MLKKLVLITIMIPIIALTGCVSQQESTGQEPEETEVKIPAEEPDKEQIQADLVGSYFRWHDEEVWYFAALSEFEDIKINETTAKGNAIEYSVTMLLKDFEMETHFIMEAFLVYKNNSNRWQLVSYLITDFREMAGVMQ